MEPGQALYCTVDLSGKQFGPADTGLQPDILNRKHFGFPVCFRLDPSDETVSVYDGENIISVFPFDGRCVDFPGILIIPDGLDQIPVPEHRVQGSQKFQPGPGFILTGNDGFQERQVLTEQIQRETDSLNPDGGDAAAFFKPVESGVPLFRGHADSQPGI